MTNETFNGLLIEKGWGELQPVEDGQFVSTGLDGQVTIQPRTNRDGEVTSMLLVLEYASWPMVVSVNGTLPTPKEAEKMLQIDAAKNA